MYIHKISQVKNINSSTDLIEWDTVKPSPMEIT